jgi:hypothetical protein
MNNLKNNRADELIQRLKQLNEFMRTSIQQLNHELVLMENEINHGKSLLKKPTVCRELLMNFDLTLN